MIKLKDLLVESQTFNFNKSKNRIMRLIKKIRDGDIIDDYWSEDFYDILRNRHSELGHLGLHKTMGFKDDAPQTWKKYFTSAAFNPNGFPIWAQRDFNRGKNDKQNGRRTYNFYITVDTSDKKNVERFINKYHFLDTSLKQFSDNMRVPIFYKTHAELDSFLADNDSLKVYYYDSSLKSDVENIVKKWARDNNITISDRSHDHGIDIEGKGSYGRILAVEILKVFINLVKNNPKATDEQYYQWLVKHFVDLIKSHIKFK